MMIRLELQAQIPEKTEEACVQGVCSLQHVFASLPLRLTMQHASRYLWGGAAQPRSSISAAIIMSWW